LATLLQLEELTLDLRLGDEAVLEILAGCSMWPSLNRLALELKNVRLSASCHAATFTAPNLKTLIFDIDVEVPSRHLIRMFQNAPLQVLECCVETDGFIDVLEAFPTLRHVHFYHRQDSLRLAQQCIVKLAAWLRGLHTQHSLVDCRFGMFTYYSGSFQAAYSEVCFRLAVNSRDNDVWRSSMNVTASQRLDLTYSDLVAVMALLQRQDWMQARLVCKLWDQACTESLLERSRSFWI
jgi:hypothetical protein